MNLIEQIRNLIKKEKSVSDIKEHIRRQNPSYNLYWVETEWVLNEINKKKSIPQILLAIKLAGNAFDPRWNEKKVQRFYNKVNPPTITGATIRQIVTGRGTFDEERTFGLEIEFARPIILTWHKIIETLQQNKINAVQSDRTDYVHHLDCWRITNDGSVEVAIDQIHSHAGSNEIKSPILKGFKGLEEVKQVLRILKALGCIINASCGLHVHHGFKKLNEAENTKTILNVCLLYNKYKGKIARLLPKERRHCHYARNFRRTEIQKITLDYDKTPTRDLLSFPEGIQGRHRAVNVFAYELHSTLEFRQHSATLDETKTINWIILTQHFMNTAEKYMKNRINLLAHNFSSIQRELGLNSDLTNYIQRRTEEMRSGKEPEYVGEVTPGMPGRPHLMDLGRRRRW
jgi:hypothetical protein